MQTFTYGTYFIHVAIYSSKITDSLSSIQFRRSVLDEYGVFPIFNEFPCRGNGCRQGITSTNVLSSQEIGVRSQLQASGRLISSQRPSTLELFQSSRQAHLFGAADFSLFTGSTASVRVTAAALLNHLDLYRCIRLVLAGKAAGASVSVFVNDGKFCRFKVDCQSVWQSICCPSRCAARFVLLN